MSYKYGTNGNDLNWDLVTLLNDICEACFEEEMKLTTQEEIDKFNDENEFYCVGHSHLYFPGDFDKIINGFREGKKLDDMVPWYIIHDTNDNFVTLVGDVPDEYLTEEYVRDRNEAEAE